MNMVGVIFKAMRIFKIFVGSLILVAFVLSSCGPKAYYKTSKGKKKQKYYNSLQFGGLPTKPPKKN